MREFTNADPIYAFPSSYNFLDRFWLKYLHDKRDLPFIHLSLKITLIMVPIGLAMYFPLPEWAWWSLAIIYFYINNFVYKASFGLMLHCTSHRRFFKPEHTLLNRYLPWILGPFFGQSPETYFCHHLGMHHSENNLEADLSSTMNYQRDSFRDFMRYFSKFFFRGFYDLIRYFHKRKRKKLRNKVIRGEITFIALCVGLSFVNFPATFMVFILPFLMSRFVMMLGNWTQHSFIEPAEPQNEYKNSITCINTSYNQKAWNDGYHTNHHLKPALHWSLYPQEFEKTLDRFAENKALIFEGVHYLHIWWYLMLGKYSKLATHLVNVNNIFSSEEEAIALIKKRLAKIDFEETPAEVQGATEALA